MIIRLFLVELRYTDPSGMLGNFLEVLNCKWTVSATNHLAKQLINCALKLVEGLPSREGSGYDDLQCKNEVLRQVMRATF